MADEKKKKALSSLDAAMKAIEEASKPEKSAKLETHGDADVDDDAWDDDEDDDGAPAPAPMTEAEKKAAEEAERAEMLKKKEEFEAKRAKTRKKAKEMLVDGLDTTDDFKERGKDDPKRHKARELEFIEEMGRLNTHKLSKTVLDHDAWSMRRGSELAEEVNKVADKLKAEALAIPEDDEPRRIERATKLNAERMIRMTDESASDWHSIAFLPEPVFEGNPEDKRRAEYTEKMWHSPEYKSLHDKTCRDDIASELAAISYGKAYMKYVIQMEEYEKKKGDGDGAGKGKGKGIGKEPSMDKACEDGMREAEKEVDDYEDTKAAFGYGGDGPRPTKADAQAIAKLHQKVKRSKKLKEIMAMAGKFRRLAASRQKIKTTHGLDEVIGTVPGDIIERLLPQELMKFADEDLEVDTFRRLVERQTMMRDVAAIDSVGKGPIIVAIDESGSMGGNKNITAKALGLAMAWIAKKQRRYIALVSYTGGGGVMAKGTYNYVVNKGGEWDAEQMSAWLEQFLSGGGSRDLPIMEMPEIYKKLDAPVGKTDLIMVSDCIIDHLPEKEVKKFNEWRKEAKANVMTIIIQGEPGQLTEMSDQIFKVPALDIDSEAVEAAVSI